MSFQKQVNALVATTKEMGNPSEETSKVLNVVDSRDIIGLSVVMTVRNILQTIKCVRQ